MRRYLLRLGAFVLMLLAAAPVVAQRTTGEIVGKVSDASGLVLPGVTVTLRSTAIQGSQTAVTSETGAYRFPVLPPGTYELEYTLSGFTTLKRENIPIVVGSTVQLDETLKVGALEETITVAGQAPVVDTSTSQVSTAYNEEWTRNAPVRRFSYFDLVNSAPGVQQNSNLGTSVAATVYGSSNNQYQVDGTVIGSDPWLNTDAIEEAEVLALGASAEFGNVQGAVFNVVTRQGGNQLHGDANIYYQNHGLVSRNTTAALDKGFPYHLASYRDGTVQVSGPFINDKFWFFGSLENMRNYDSQPGVDPAFPSKSEEKRMFWKFTYSINSNHQLMNAYHDDFYKLPAVATAFTAPSTLRNSHGHNPTPNMVYTGVLTSRTFVEGRFSGKWLQSSADPQVDGQSSQGIRYTDQDTQLVTGAITGFSENRSWQYGGSAKLSHTADHLLGGSHDLKTGFQFTTIGNVTFSGNNDAIRFFSVRNLQSTGTTQLPQLTGTRSITYGTFLDDTYRLGNRVTLNLGLRFDYSKGYYPSFPLLDAAGNPTGKESQANNNVYDFGTVSPRLGINYRLFKDTIVKGHYGRYYDALARDFGSIVPSTTATVTFNCIMPCVDPASRSSFTTSSAANNRVDSGRTNDYTDQYIVQLEQGIVQDLGLQVNYVHKDGKNLPGSQDITGQYVLVPYLDNVGVDATGNTVMVSRLVSPASDRVFLLTNQPDLYTRYNGMVVVLSKRMSHNWQGVISLSVSKSEGNGGTSTFGQTPNDYLFAAGLQQRDRPVVAKAQVTYRFPWGFMAAVNTQHQSGEPYRRQVQPAGLGFPTQPTINMESRSGDRRFPALDQTDLRVQKGFKLTGSRRIDVFMDALNLFNNAKSEDVASTVGTNSSFGVPTNIIIPRRLQLGAKFVW